VAQKIIGAGGEAVLVPGDVSKEDVNKTMVETAVDNFGQLDIVFLKAGSLANVKILVDVTEEQVDNFFGVNVKIIVFGLKHAALPAIAKLSL
jgi:NAD(P)-dependent dehydrogenase (short-subunit alcohol dehydrogenase family)